MTRSQDAKQGQGVKQWQNATRNFVNWPTLELAITFRAHKRAMMTEIEDAFSGPRLCLYTLNCLSFGSFRVSAHESCIQGANHVRGGRSVEIHTCAATEQQTGMVFPIALTSGCDCVDIHRHGYVVVLHFRRLQVTLNGPSGSAVTVAQCLGLQMQGLFRSRRRCRCHDSDGQRRFWT